ncbi:SpvB-domain-containing protein [Aulographum hederae CBS 113979]|uniref:SpvB-domain-containing protein n=1 Tax=Aulographum hederae CBS 113979 TaxID=1176131 RepID=A0A6G1GPZ6_9PEZI|nr:SpvB-domain-containing protein [Aulographum hederae CBS 113979]
MAFPIPFQQTIQAQESSRSEIFSPLAYQSLQNALPHAALEADDRNGDQNTSTQAPSASALPAAPSLSLPKGGGSIHGIGEKFDVNSSTGTGSASIPIKVSPARGVQPQLSVNYNSGSGNSVFGLGFQLAGIPSITRKTDKGLPKYQQTPEGHDSDVFLLADSEDLVPLFKRDALGRIVLDQNNKPSFDEIARNSYLVRKYSPRIDTSFMRIERWTNVNNPDDIHWRTISPANQTTIFGLDDGSRIQDPDMNYIQGQSARVFSWLVSEIYDARGNAMIFNYKPENSSNVPTTDPNEANRSNVSRSANRHLQSIQYGNTIPNRNDDWLPMSASAIPGNSWKFSVVFDYGEYDTINPKPSDSTPWLCRPDSFSTYRPGFEIRVYRLCRRILMFHHFDELPVADYLVSATEFNYDENGTATYLTSVVQSGFSFNPRESAYKKRSLPPLEFAYATFPSNEELSRLQVKEVIQAGAERASTVFDTSTYKWIDLDGEGMTGLLTEQASGWFYWRNLSPNNLVTGDDGFEIKHAKLDGLEILDSRPNRSVTEGAHFGDILGSGNLNLIQTGGRVWGYHERSKGGDWSVLHTFPDFPNVDTSDPTVKFVDLTGDGLPDVLLCGDHLLSWYPFLGQHGYGPNQMIAQPFDEQARPTCVLSDSKEAMYLADMSGDGLQDFIRIRNGDVCYWPNCGYGRFGAMIRMANSPRFDDDDTFHQKRIRLADVDGSGTTDILYVGLSHVNMFLNHSGNSFSGPKTLKCLPNLSDAATVEAVDLIGNGTACLVWSSALPMPSPQPLRYVDLTSGKKPHLLVSITNNLGKKINIRYAPSTKFYLDDKQRGTPWLTRLHFPVHCIEKLETIDHVGNHRLVQSYSYHHGYFDGKEREFRGFARVDQWDTELFATTANDASASATPLWRVPPVHTKTWFHTGAYFDDRKVSRYLTHEYFGAPPSSDQRALSSFYATLLPDTVVPSRIIDAESYRESCRALKGTILRQEVYSADGSSLADIPYSVRDSNFTVESLQSVQDVHSHSVFTLHPRESVNYIYERSIRDPRVQHQLTLQVDRFGNIEKEIKIAYGRPEGNSPLTGPDKLRQTTPMITYSENDFTNSVYELDDFRNPVLSETREYELSGFQVQAGKTRFTFDDFGAPNMAPILSLVETPFENLQQSSSKQKRLIHKSRTMYRRDDLSDVLPLGKLESLALPGVEYTLCFTPGLLDAVYNRPRPDGSSEELLPEPGDVLGGTGPGQAGYIDLDHDGHWWKPSNRAFFSSDQPATPMQELTDARQHFFQPRSFVDAFTNRVSVRYDDYSLMPVQTADPLGNTTVASIDYRVLSPKQITDPNGNRTEAAFDALGLVVGSATRGKVHENFGDTVDGLELDPTPLQLDEFFADPRGPAARSLLGNATLRVMYNQNRYWKDAATKSPNYAAVIVREVHSADSNDAAAIHVAFSYSDGFGRIIQQKVQAKSGAVDGGADANADRWIGSGWVVHNNKGDPVKQYEPFFDGTHDINQSLRGVASTLFYDPLGRVVATLHPDHSVEKVVSTPWSETKYDANDNILISNPRDDPNVGHYFESLPADEYLPSWYDMRIEGQLGPEEKAAAEKTKSHVNTPTTSHLDPLGSAFMTFQASDSNARRTTRSHADIQGNIRQLFDGLGRLVLHTNFDMSGSSIHEANIDSGERWSLPDVSGKSLFSWSSRGFRHMTTYDELRRATEYLWSDNSGDGVLVQKIEYGEPKVGRGLTESEASTSNSRGKIIRVLDQAGVSTMNGYDFKGNMTGWSRRFAQNYKSTLNWKTQVPLEDAVHTTTSTFDAVNRPMKVVSPDQSVVQYAYNAGGTLEQIRANIQGEEASTAFMESAEHDAKGQLAFIKYGNGVSTRREYNSLTFRLKRLTTTRPSRTGREVLQDLNYTYDPVGNVSHIRDDALLATYFRNAVIEPGADFAYDSFYRLVRASGREDFRQRGPTMGRMPSGASNGDDIIPSDGSAVAQYEEVYEYDYADNVLSVRHTGSASTQPGWTRKYSYDSPGAMPNPISLDPNFIDHQSNRVTSISVSGITESYGYEGNAGLHGNITSMPQLQRMDWDIMDQLRSSSKQIVRNGGTPETTYYVYDGKGQRVRKVNESQAAAGEQPRKMKERFYVGSFQLFRKYNGDGRTVGLERETLEIKGGGSRVALVESLTQGTDANTARRQHRYQFDNHIGSVVLELNQDALISSYEEYTPFGETSYQSSPSQTEIPKRYRFNGKERDEETGLYYYGARYYAPWMCKWISPDPIGVKDNLNVFVFSRNNPVRFVDDNGMFPGDIVAKLAEVTHKVATAAGIGGSASAGAAPVAAEAAATGAGVAAGPALATGAVASTEAVAVGGAVASGGATTAAVTTGAAVGATEAVGIGAAAAGGLAALAVGAVALTAWMIQNGHGGGIGNSMVPAISYPLNGSSNPIGPNFVPPPGWPSVTPPTAKVTTPAPQVAPAQTAPPPTIKYPMPWDVETRQRVLASQKAPRKEEDNDWNPQWHHIIPQYFRSLMPADVDIDAIDMGRVLPARFHALMSWSYNIHWAAWITTNTKNGVFSATAKEIYAEAARLDHFYQTDRFWSPPTRFDVKPQSARTPAMRAQVNRIGWTKP